MSSCSIYLKKKIVIKTLEIIPAPICKENEVPTNCVGFGCGPRKCSELGGPILCIDPAPGACKKGCHCMKGYLRDANGTCIPEKDCGPSK